MSQCEIRSFLFFSRYDAIFTLPGVGSRGTKLILLAFILFRFLSFLTFFLGKISAGGFSNN